MTRERRPRTDYSPVSYRWERPVCLSVLALLFLLQLRFLQGNAILEDAFHHGEYFAAATWFQSSSPRATPPPLTIHGALDVIPAVFAGWIWGTDRHFLWTAFSYKVAGLAAALLFIATAFDLTRTHPLKVPLRLATVFIAPWTLGYRDLVLIAGVYIFVLDLRLSRTLLQQTAVSGLLGAVLAFGLFWSFDRGLVGIAALGLAILYRSRSQPWRLSLIVAFALTATILSIVEPRLFSPAVYFHNVLFLVETSAKWGYGWQRWPVSLTVFAFAINGMAAWIYLRRNDSQLQESTRIVQVIAFVLLALGYWKMGTNRADIRHIAWTLWTPLLLLTAAPVFRRGWAEILTAMTLMGVGFAVAWHYKAPIVAVVSALLPLSTMTAHPFAKLSRTLFIAGLTIASLHGLLTLVRASTAGAYQWVVRLPSAPPNSLVVQSAVREVAQTLVASGARCVFDLSNSGLINGLSALPSCTEFTYPVYAGPKHEQEMMAQLFASPPPVIVYSSTLEAYAIDGIPMSARLPTLDRELRRRYPREVCGTQFCLRYER